MTDDVKYIVRNQAGYDWMNKGSIIEVDVRGLNIEEHRIEGIKVTQLDGNVDLLKPPNEFIFRGKIAPDRLKVINKHQINF